MAETVSAPFVEPVEVDRGSEFQDLAPGWFEYAHIASPDKTKSLRDYLSSLVQPILALDGVHISSVRFLISDDDEPNAAVVNRDPDNAVVYVTKGMLRYVDSEDELVGILAHELGHIEISARIGSDHRNSRPEEIGADGFAAQWMVQIGRNWRALQNFFKKMAAEEEKFDGQEFSAHKFQQQIADEHSTALDRVQHVQTAVGILAIQQQREIPEPAPRPMPDEVREQATQASHVSYLDLLLAHEKFETLSPRVQLEILTNLDPRHYQRRIFTAEQRKTGPAFAEAATQDYALRERGKAVRATVLNSLKALANEKGNTRNWSEDDKALLNKAVDVAGLHSEINPYGNSYIHLNLPVYLKVNRMLFGPKAGLEPLGQPLTRLASCMARFVDAKTPDAALAAAQALNAEVQTHTALAGHAEMFGTNEEWQRDLVLYKSLKLPHFHSAKARALPWSRHVKWATDDQTGAIAEALWRIGINKDKKLWQAIPSEQLEERGKEWNFTQPSGALARYSHTDARLLEAIGKGKQWDYIAPDRSEKNVTRYARDLAVNDAAVKKFKSFTDRKLKAHFNQMAMSVPAFTPGKLAEELSEFAMKNEKLLRAPIKFVKDPVHFPEPDYAQDFSLHAQRTQALTEAVAACLASGAAEDREAARDFFMEENSYGNVAVPCMAWLTRGWEKKYPWQSPLMQFIAQDQFGLFNPLEKASLLLQFGRYTGGNGKCGPDVDKPGQDIEFWRKEFGWERSADFTQLAAVAQKLDIGKHERETKKEKEEDDEEEKKYQWRSGEDGRRNERNWLFNDEFRQVLDGNPAIITPGFAALAAFYLDEMKASILSGFLPAGIRRKIADIFRGDHVDIKDVRFDARVLKDMTVEQMIDVYQFLDHEALMPNISWKVEFGKYITNIIEARPEAGQKKDLYERLVFTSRRGLEVPLSDFVLAEKAFESWAALAARDIGRDDGSDAYYQKAIPLLDQIEKGISERDRFGAFRMFADAIAAQRPVCHDIEKRIELKKENLDWKADVAVRGAETFMNWLRRTRENREDALDFFMQAEDDAGVSRMTGKFMAWLDEDLIARKASFVFESGIVSLGELNTPDEEAKALLTSAEVNRKIKERVDEIGRASHRFFWSRSLELRTLFVNYLLMTPQDLNKDPEKAWRTALEMTLDRLFAKTAPDKSEELRNLWAREFLETYLESAHESERSLIMAALISSAQVDTEGHSRSFGERLANILGMLGPAYYKLGQAIHSHPQTPEDIRAPMAKLKSLGEKPPRWTFLRQVDEAVPVAMRDRIVWTGDIVGRASFFTTSPVRMEDGEDFMLGILGRNAAREAAHGFKRIEACARKLAAKNQDFAAISRTAIAMIRQARDLVKVETDLHVGARQAMVMQEQYGGLTAEADGHVFHYEPKAWRYYGDYFKLMDIAQGHHFDEMPEATAAQAARKKAFAKADSAVELMFPLSGRRSDNDRHERQMKIDGDVVGLFDPGGMRLEEPTSADKKALADALKVLLPVVSGADNGENDATTVLTRYLADLEDRTGSCPDYLMHIQKSLLARGGFHRYLSAADFSDIFSGLLRGGHVDSVIRNALIFDTSKWNMAKGLGLLRTAFQSPAVKITQAPVVRAAEPVYIPADGPKAKMPVNHVIPVPVPAREPALQFAV